MVYHIKFGDYHQTYCFSPTKPQRNKSLRLRLVASNIIHFAFRKLGPTSDVNMYFRNNQIITKKR